MNRGPSASPSTKINELAMRWLAGWSAASGHPWTEEDGVVRIEALMESRRIEYLLVDPSPADIVEISGRIGGDPRDVVTIFAADPATYLVPHQGLSIDRDDEALMTVDLSAAPSDLPAGYEAHWDEDGYRVNLNVVFGGELAASGNLALVGHDAIFDRIETMPRFQRRGLGTAMMRSLTSWAIAREAETGILAASADGQRLYEHLGWKTECAMLMFRGAE